MSTYVCEIQEDPETGEAIIEFPPELVAELGWKDGDVLAWSIGPGQVLVAQKKLSIFERLRKACMQLITRVRALKSGMA